MVYYTSCAPFRTLLHKKVNQNARKVIYLEVKIAQELNRSKDVTFDEVLNTCRLT